MFQQPKMPPGDCYQKQTPKPEFPFKKICPQMLGLIHAPSGLKLSLFDNHCVQLVPVKIFQTKSRSYHF